MALTNEIFDTSCRVRTRKDIKNMATLESKVKLSIDLTNRVNTGWNVGLKVKIIENN